MFRIAFCVCFALFLLNGTESHAQNTDSIKRIIDDTRDPQKKISSLLDLCAQRKSLQIDTFEHYVKVLQVISKEKGSPTDQHWADFYYAAFLLNKGFTDSAIGIINNYLPHLDQSPSEKSLSIRSSFLKTNAFVRKNQFREALREYYYILNEAQQQHDTLSLAMARNGLGWVHMEIGQYRNAATWLLSALGVTRDSTFYQKYSYVYSNLASVYNSLSKPDSAEYFIHKAIRGAEIFHDQEAMANSLNILADTYINTNRSKAAESLLKRIIDIRKQIGDPYYIVSDMMQLSKFYAHNQAPDQGIAVSLEGIAMAKKLNLTSKLPVLYESLAENYKAKGDYKNYAETLNDLILIKDSVYKINSADVEREMETRYELQRNDNTIIRQQLSLVQKNYMLDATILLLIVVSLAAIFVFTEYRKKNRLRMLLMMENEKQMRMKAIMEAEENQRRRISGDLHDSLGVQANAILYGTELLQQETRLNSSLVSDLHDTAKDMLVTLRETLWAMKVKEATAAEVWLRVINFSKQLGRYYPSVNISTSGVVPAGFHIIAAKSLNIVLILQEALNNSVRHSGAGTIIVTSMDNGDEWTLVLEDDGHGFDPEAAEQKRESYGLVNMKTRAEASDIHLEIIAAENKGVKIIMSIRHPQ